MRQNFVIILALGFLLNGCSEQNQNLSTFQASLLTVQDAVRIDAVRQSKVNKVIQIIDGYNQTMPLESKRAIANEIYDMSIKYPNLDVELICATITHESARTWDPTVVSKAGAMGLMQIMPPTGKWLARYENFGWQSAEETLFNAIYNIKLGSRYLSALIETYDLDGGLAAYNGGEKRVGMWLAQNKIDGILWPETRKYVPSVLELYDEFRDDMDRPF